MPPNIIPDETVGRIASYVDFLRKLPERDVLTVSSQELATAAGVNAAQVRKDFSYLVSSGSGSFGTPGVGYDVRRLLHYLTRFLGMDRERAVLLVGYGKLGSALADYRGFKSRGFKIAAIMDTDRNKVGTVVDGVTVRHLDDLEAVVKEARPEVAVLTTPSAEAQAVTDRLMAVGVTAILNFAPVVLVAPESAVVRQVDLSRELALLSFRQAQGNYP